MRVPSISLCLLILLIRKNLCLFIHKHTHTHIRTEYGEKCTRFWSAFPTYLDIREFIYIIHTLEHRRTQSQQNCVRKILQHSEQHAPETLNKEYICTECRSMRVPSGETTVREVVFWMRRPFTIHLISAGGLDGAVLHCSGISSFSRASDGPAMDTCDGATVPECGRRREGEIHIYVEFMRAMRAPETATARVNRARHVLGASQSSLSGQTYTSRLDRLRP